MDRGCGRQAFHISKQYTRFDREIHEGHICTCYDTLRCIERNIRLSASGDSNRKGAEKCPQLINDRGCQHFVASGSRDCYNSEGGLVTVHINNNIVYIVMFSSPKYIYQILRGKLPTLSPNDTDEAEYVPMSSLDRVSCRMEHTKNGKPQKQRNIKLQKIPMCSRWLHVQLLDERDQRR